MKLRQDKKFEMFIEIFTLVLALIFSGIILTNTVNAAKDTSFMDDPVIQDFFIPGIHRVSITDSNGINSVYNNVICQASASTTAVNDNQVIQTRPIKLGTSGGNVYDTNIIYPYLYCCSGTLGALVQDSTGNKYILSNNHVLAKTNIGKKGDPVSQPGLIDNGCNVPDIVANLYAYNPISFSYTIGRGRNQKTVYPNNLVDGAIAQVRKDCPGNIDNNCVDTTGSILGIGVISNNIVPPSLYLPVQKSGRTTGVTSGKITAIDATVLVTYSQKCASKSTQTAKFIKQVVIGPGGFSAGGDSGSLIHDTASPPHAVGLLFAGSSTVTIANPISDVLVGLGVTMVGTEPTTSSFPSSIGSIMTVSSKLPSKANEKAIENAKKVKEFHEKSIFSNDGVIGVGIGVSENAPENVVIKVYTKKKVNEMKGVIPESLDNIPIEIVETDEIVAR
jgi:hypothetical protein